MFVIQNAEGWYYCGRVAEGFRMKSDPARMPAFNQFCYARMYNGRNPGRLHAIARALGGTVVNKS